MNVIKCTFIYKIGTPHYSKTFTSKLEQFSNVTLISGSYDHDNYKAYNFSGNGKTEFAVPSSAHMGLITDDWVEKHTQQHANFYWVKQDTTYDDTHDYCVIYFLTENNVLRGFFDPLKGNSVLFYYKDNIMYSELQCQDGSGNSLITQYMPATWTTGTYPIFTGNQIFTSYPFGKYCEAERRVFALDSFTVPNGKMMKYQATFDAPITPEYINMFGGNTPYNYVLSPTAERISVGGKNYIHIGGTKWMPYESYSEETVNEPE